MSHSRHVDRRHTWMRALKLEELEQRLLLNGDPVIGSVVYPYELSGLDGNDGFKLKTHHSVSDFGNSVSTAGDVNGDGFGDFIISSYYDDDGGNSAGQTYLILGKASGWSMDTDLSDADASFIGEDSIEKRGYAVSRDDDVNREG